MLSETMAHTNGQTLRILINRRSNLRRLRLGEEKKEDRKKKIEETGQNVIPASAMQGGPGHN